MTPGKKYFVRSCLNLTAVSLLVIVASLIIQTTVSASSVLPATGVTPNGSCDIMRNDTCYVNFSGTLAGSLAATVGTSVITLPTVLDGTPQTAHFTFTMKVVDTRGADSALWTLSAASDGLTVNTINGTTTDPFVITDITAACAAAASCSNAAITGIPGTLMSTDSVYATAPDGGDFGTTVVTVVGNVPLGADTIGGAYSGTISITGGPIIS